MVAYATVHRLVSGCVVAPAVVLGLVACDSGGREIAGDTTVAVTAADTTDETSGPSPSTEAVAGEHHALVDALSSGQRNIAVQLAAGLF